MSRHGQGSGNLMRTIIGKRCGAVRFGGSAGSAFHLSFGRMVRVPPPILRSPLLRRLAKAEPASSRDLKPEFGLMVWSSWRLSRSGRVLTASQASTKGELLPLRRLKGARVIAVSSEPSFHDLAVEFSGRLRLDVFCDMAPTSIDASAKAPNWALFDTQTLVAGA